MRHADGAIVREHRAGNEIMGSNGISIRTTASSTRRTGGTDNGLAGNEGVSSGINHVEATVTSSIGWHIVTTRAGAATEERFAP